MHHYIHHRFYSLFLIVFTTFLLLLSCRKGSEKEGADKAQKKPHIVATVGMISDAVENIARGRVTVQALMGPGVDPHLYKATQGDLKKLMDADLILYNGLYLEGKMGEVFDKLQHTKPVVAVSEKIPEEKLRRSAQHQNAVDPHIWFDVSLWKYAVQRTSTALQEIAPEHTAYFQKNTEQYLKRLDSLHHSVTQSISSIPRTQRVLITAHDAFGYFGDAYGMEVRGLQGISTLSEFGLKDRSDLVRFILKRKIKAIFVETSVSKKAINSVMEDCREQGMDVRIGGSLYSDAMGKSGTPEGTYIGMVHTNVDKIVRALK